jgi:hypothetical protein
LTLNGTNKEKPFIPEKGCRNPARLIMKLAATGLMQTGDLRNNFDFYIYIIYFYNYG